MKETAIRLLKNYDRMSLNPESVSLDVKEAAWEVYEAIKPLQPKNSQQEKRSIWINVARGDIEQWRSFEEYAQEEAAWNDNPHATEAQWRNEWLWEYPNEEEWHYVTVFREEEWLVIRIDGRTVANPDPSSESSWPDPVRASALRELSKELTRMLGFVREESYGQLVESKLPYRYRWGFMPRKTFWQVAGDAAKRFGGNMPSEEAKELDALMRNQGESEDLPKLKDLTMAQYFAALKEAYKAAGFVNEHDSWLGFDKDDPRAWYCHFGDARDETLFDISQESPDAMRAVFESRVQFNHGFEVLAGRGCTRVHLVPSLTGDGLWYLSMHGSFDAHADDVARMWRKLNEIGMPTYLHRADELASILLGEDQVLFAPQHEYVDYLSGRELFGRKVGIGLHLWEDYEDAIIAHAEWMPIDVPKLSLLG